MNPSGRRTLVTGGAGFIGSHLVRRLCRERFDVFVIDNLQAGSWSTLGDCLGPASRYEVDVRDTKALGKVIGSVRPTYIYHLAANASVPGSVEAPVYDFETNAQGTFNVMMAARELSPAPRVILASSGAVYGEPSRFPIVETDFPRPISPYGTSKLCAEEIVGMFSRVYGCDGVIARIFNTYGPGMPRFIVLDLLKKLQRNRDTLEILGDGTQLRDFNYIDDTVAGLITLALRAPVGSVFNVASGSSVTVASLAELLLTTLGLSGRTRLVFTGASWPGDAQRWSVDVSRLMSLGYSPGVTLDKGLARVVEWFEVAVGKIPRN